jgi:microcystin-dependent protein
VSEPFLGELRIFSFNFAPKSWALCNGQLLPINQNQALFSLLGTMYGGNGQTTFALPNLQGRVPIHVGNGHIQGEAAGISAVTITPQTMPTHTHMANAANAAPNSNAPGTGRLLSNSQGANLYAAATNLQTMAPDAVSNVGGSQAHENMGPYLVLNFCIALLGIFPSRN